MPHRIFQKAPILLCARRFSRQDDAIAILAGLEPFAVDSDWQAQTLTPDQRKQDKELRSWFLCSDLTEG